jgi:hypothetical protein
MSLSAGLLETTAGGERLCLLPHRALFLPGHGVLLVADAHIGKAVSFRRLGVPVPAGTTEATLQRLSDALALTQARGQRHARQPARRCSAGSRCSVGARLKPERA